MTTKKSNGFDTPLFNTEPFREEQPVRTDPEIDKDDSVIDVEDVQPDSPPPLLPKEEVIQEESHENIKIEEENEKTDKKEKKYNPLDVANLTSKDPPKSRSPPRKKLLPANLEYPHSFGRIPRPWRPDGGVFYGDDVDYSVPITTAYLKHMRNMGSHDRMDLDNKVR